MANIFDDIPVHGAYTISSPTVVTHYDMLQILIVLCATCMVQGVDTVLNQHLNLFLDVVGELCPMLLMTHTIITVLDANMPNLPRICLFLGSTNFLSLTHYDMLQLLIVFF